MIAELRQTLADDGRPAGDIDAVLDRVEAVFRAVERGGGEVDVHLGWCIVGLVGERLLRRQKQKRAGRQFAAPIAVAGDALPRTQSTV